MLRSARRAASLTRGLRLTLAAPTALEATTTAFTANSHVFAVGATRSLCTASPEPSPVHHARRDAEEASTSETADSSLHRTQMLDAALKHVKTMGWTDDALRAAAAELSLSPAAVGLLPRGAAELVEHFNARCDAEFVTLLQPRQSEFAAMRIRDRITKAVRMRLELNAPHISTWAQALSLQATPSNAVFALQQRAALFDEIWHFMGDKSTDMSWYTKRATLGAVYSATELFMITDTSPEFADTWAFLDRRIADVMQMGKSIGQMTEAASAWLANSRVTKTTTK